MRLKLYLNILEEVNWKRQKNFIIWRRKKFREEIKETQVYFFWVIFSFAKFKIVYEISIC